MSFKQCIVCGRTLDENEFEYGYSVCFDCVDDIEKSLPIFIKDGIYDRKEEKEDRL